MITDPKRYYQNQEENKVPVGNFIILIFLVRPIDPSASEGSLR